MKGLLELLTASGVDVCGHSDHDDWSEVEFRGDYTEAMRAVELALTSDCNPQGLVGHWTIWGGDILAPDWTLLFDRAGKE